MPYFILGLALIVGSLLILRWYVNARPSTLLKVTKWLVIGTICALAIFFLIAGPKSWALWSIPVLLPWLMRFRSAMRYARNWSRMRNAESASSRGTESTSEVQTDFLKMYLNHHSGEMKGDIIKGRFSGKKLENLSIDDLGDLLDEVYGDDQSLQVLQAYLDRYYGSDWQSQNKGAYTKGQQNGAMTVEQAHKILNLNVGASKSEIREAHRRLMTKLHPDHGGSNYLAAQINQAKDLLLGG